MDLAAIMTAIASWIALVTGLPVRRLERSQSFGANQILIHMRGFRGIGIDEVSETYDAATDLGPAWGDITGGFTPSQTGQRVGTLEIRAETQSQSDDEDSLYYVQMIRDRLALPDCVEALDAAGAAIGEVLLEPRELSDTRNMRRVSVSQMDVGINAATVAAGTPYGTIEKVDLTVVGQDADGSTVFETTKTVEV